MPNIFGSMCGSSARRSKPTPSNLNTSSPKRESVIGCVLPTDPPSSQRHLSIQMGSIQTRTFDRVSRTMKISDFLSSTDATTDVVAFDKQQLLHELAGKAG